MISSIGVNTFPSNANTVSPFATSGREAVGLENLEAKDDLFSPVEEPPKKEAALNDDKKERVGDEPRRQGEQQAGSEQDDLDESELAQIRELRARDAEVRAHEAAHASVGGQYAGAPSYSYETGPNGVKYAVGGEVSISLPANADNPLQTIQAAEQVRRAALAPADPSGQDRRVAASAARVAISARAELRAQQAEERRLAAAEKAEAKSERELAEAQRKSRIESVRSSNFLSSNLSTPENVSGANAPGQVLDQIV
ncbi:catalase [Dasania sp. GY-MA-18]|uniref:Metalloprotease CJM1_0395 family protein n=1 Tax=Dasania phycosphaerae TaxID=2950436 RepID=A0A9J6RJE4_9GAMM|nr:MULTISPECIES: putative metalloprotease CJM1_0395 family protein [Dasania]MCR8922394.1 catalase [Dasania sp. GY-MA-18]MCZ0864822.1 putative metalloprotease CJM1_0395 family protein [Dasania phycosphaerae]MCZ0868550.1 putative metalloprotease CJM1_0395 family protein [Dasania phycosphaerae]